MVFLSILPFGIVQCNANEPIYIRSNGIVEPASAPISRNEGNRYSLTSNIYNSLIVERNDISIDGCGYTLQGTKIPYEIGIELSDRQNITVTNLQIADFGIAIELWRARNVTLSGNRIVDSVFYGFDIWNSTDVNITENEILRNQIGIKIEVSSSNIVFANNIQDNKYGIHLFEALHNTIYGNNFVDNEFHVFLEFAGPNSWDYGYPTGGNYWSDFTDVYADAADIYRGPTQNQMGSDGFWDTPYLIDENNRDNYPVVPEPSGPPTLFFPVLLVALAVILVVALVIRGRLVKKPPHLRNDCDAVTKQNVKSQLSTFMGLTSSPRASLVKSICLKIDNYIVRLRGS